MESRPVALARHYGFDGWFVNIEHELDGAAGQPQRMAAFVAQLTEAMHAASPHGTVVWYVRPSMLAGPCRNGADAAPPRACGSDGPGHRYDSVTEDGRLDWQNGLTPSNAVYFAGCDGLFTNYTWRTHQPMASAAAALPERRPAIYTGIDVFGRGTYGGGGFAVHAVGNRPLRASVPCPT